MKCLKHCFKENKFKIPFKDKIRILHTLIVGDIKEEKIQPTLKTEIRRQLCTTKPTGDVTALDMERRGTYFICFLFRLVNLGQNKVSLSKAT